jgi:uncharacterized protein YkwD
MTAIKLRAVRVFAAVFTAAVVFMCAFGTSMRSVGVEDTVENKKELAKEMTLLINEERAANGAKPLYLVPYLCDCANVRARECIFRFDHTRNDNEDFATVIDTTLVPYAVAAENIAAAYSAAQDTFNQWMGSESHHDAMLNPCYTHIGVGVCYEPNSDYGWYWEILLVECDTEIQGQEVPARYDVVPECAGDINGDSEVNNFDLICLRQYFTGYYQMNDLQLEAADLLVDGNVTYLDAQVLQGYILGKYTTLPMTLSDLM